MSHLARAQMCISYYKSPYTAFYLFWNIFIMQFNMFIIFIVIFTWAHGLFESVFLSFHTYKNLLVILLLYISSAIAWCSSLLLSNIPAAQPCRYLTSFRTSSRTPAVDLWVGVCEGWAHKHKDHSHLSPFQYRKICRKASWNERTVRIAEKREACKLGVLRLRAFQRNDWPMTDSWQPLNP